MAAGNTYYVATTGSNSSCSTNVNAPMRTINFALSCLQLGDTLLVRSGTYNEQFDSANLVASGTSWTNKIRIAAYPNGCASSCESVTVKPGSGVGSGTAAVFSNVQYIEVDGINFDDTLSNTNASG